MKTIREIPDLNQIIDELIAPSREEYALRVFLFNIKNKICHLLLDGYEIVLRISYKKGVKDYFSEKKEGDVSIFYDKACRQFYKSVSLINIKGPAKISIKKG